MSNPFATNPFGGAVEESVEKSNDVVEESNDEEEDTESTSENGEKKTRKPRTSTNRRQTIDDIRYIVQNYKDIPTAEICRKTGLTKQQIYTTIRKIRTTFIAKAETMSADDSQKLREWIDENLPVRKGDNATAGVKRENAANAIFEELFGSLLGKS